MTEMKGKSWVKRHWILTSILGVFFLFIIFGVLSDLISNDTNNSDSTNTIDEGKVVSTSFEDFNILCDNSATDLQKQKLFNDKFKDQYVQWTGKVYAIEDPSSISMCGYKKLCLRVRHCGFSYNIVISMKGEQIDELLEYREGDTITYKAKLTGLSMWLNADEGEIVKIQP